MKVSNDINFILVATLMDTKVDYILFVKADVDIHVNSNEVRDVRYVTAEQLKSMFAAPDYLFTPWFRIICRSKLFSWWERLDQGMEEYVEELTISRMLAEDAAAEKN